MGGGGGRGAGGLEPPKLKLRFDAKTIAKVVYDFRAHIFCPPKTKDILTKHDETGSPEQLHANALP